MNTPESHPSEIPLCREIMRLVLAIVFAPLAVPLLGLVLGLLTGNVPSGGTLYKWTLTIIGIPYTYAVGLLVGLPVHLLFRYLLWRSWWHYALAGLLGGTAFADYVGEPSALSLSVFGFYGLITALTAWAIAVHRWKRDRVGPDEPDDIETPPALNQPEK